MRSRRDCTGEETAVGVADGSGELGLDAEAAIVREEIRTVREQVECKPNSRTNLSDRTVHHSIYFICVAKKKDSCISKIRSPSEPEKGRTIESVSDRITFGATECSFPRIDSRSGGLGSHITHHRALTCRYFPHDGSIVTVRPPVVGKQLTVLTQTGSHGSANFKFKARKLADIVSRVGPAGPFISANLPKTLACSFDPTL